MPICSFGNFLQVNPIANQKKPSHQKQKNLHLIDNHWHNSIVETIKEDTDNFYNVLCFQDHPKEWKREIPQLQHVPTHALLLSIWKSICLFTLERSRSAVGSVNSPVQGQVTSRDTCKHIQEKNYLTASNVNIPAQQMITSRHTWTPIVEISSLAVMSAATNVHKLVT